MMHYTKPWYTDEQKIKREIQVFLLCKLYSNDAGLVFKGGTAIDLFYGSNRFSEDLDFCGKDMEGLTDIDEAIERLDTDTEYEIRNDWHAEREMHARFVRYLLKVYNKRLDKLVEMIIDYSADVPKYHSDKQLLKCGKALASVDVMQPKEILAEKVSAIMTRQKARDLYDLYYLAVVRGFPVELKDIYEKCSKGFSAGPVKYSFRAFGERVLKLKSRWGELDPLLENSRVYKFDLVSKEVLDKLKSIQ